MNHCKDCADSGITGIIANLGGCDGYVQGQNALEVGQFVRQTQTECSSGFFERQSNAAKKGPDICNYE